MARSLKLNCWRIRLAMFQLATSCVVFLLQRWQPEICTFLHNLNFSILDWLKWFVVLNWPIFPHNLIVWYKFDCIILANKLCAFQTDFCIIFKWCFVSSESCLCRLPLTPDIPILAGPGQLWPDQLWGYPDHRGRKLSATMAGISCIELCDLWPNHGRCDWVCRGLTVHCGWILTSIFALFQFVSFNRQPFSVMLN